MKYLLALVCILMLAVPAFANDTNYSVSASSGARVGSASGTFGHGVSGSLAIAGNTSNANVSFSNQGVTTQATSMGGTFTAGYHAITFAGQGGSAHAYGSKGR